MQKKKLSNDQKKTLQKLKQKLLQAIEGNPAEKRFTDKI